MVRIARPSYPVKAELVLGLMLMAWGAWGFTQFGSIATHSQSWYWLWSSGQLFPVSLAAFILGAFKVYCAITRWRVAGKAAAFLAIGLWFQLAYKAYMLVSPTPALVYLYAVAMVGSFLILFAEDA